MWKIALALTLIVILVLLLWREGFHSRYAGRNSVSLWRGPERWGYYSAADGDYLRIKQKGEITRIDIDFTHEPGFVEIWGYKPGSNVDTIVSEWQKNSVYDITTPFQTEYPTHMRVGTIQDGRRFYGNLNTYLSYDPYARIGEDTREYRLKHGVHWLKYHPDWVLLARGVTGDRGTFEVNVPVNEHYIHVEYPSNSTRI